MLKKIMPKKWVMMIGILSWHLSLPTWSYPYSEIYVFGDSLSDTGRLYAATGLPPEPFYYQGRASNGPLWIEYLATQIKLTENAYNSATNFAWASASSGEITFWSEEGLGLQLQIDAYLENNTTADPDGLYMIWAGSNDFLDEVSNPQQILATTVTHLVNAVNQLRTHGAQHIVVLGLPDLGKVPENVNSDSAALMSYLIRSFNDSLAAALKPLNVIYIDMQTAFEIVTDPQTIMPSFFKLSNFTEICFDVKTLTSCNEPDHYFFWDERHPTTVGHQLIALIIYSVVARPVYLNFSAIAPFHQQTLILPVIEVINDTGNTLLLKGLMSHDPTHSPIEFNLLQTHLQTSRFSFQDLVTYPNEEINYPQFEVATGKLYLPIVQVAEYHQMAEKNTLLTLTWQEKKYTATLQWKTKINHPFQTPYFTLEEIVFNDE